MNHLFIVGLGNPGTKYVSTRHNVGFAFIEYIAKEMRAVFKVKKQLNGELAEFSTADRKVFLFKPSTYMNASGLAVKQCLDYYGLSVASTWVLHDELDFNTGKVRLKFGGGHGGHNGLRDVHRHLGSGDYWRCRIGIGHPNNAKQVSDYVLHKPTQAGQVEISVALDRLMLVLDLVLQDNFEQAMLNLHTQSD